MKKLHILTFDPLRWGHMTRSPLTFLKLWLLSTRWHNKILNWSCFHIFHMVNVFDPCDPIWPRVNFKTHNFCTEYLADQYARVTWPYYLICRRRSILKIVKKLHILTFDPLRWGHMTRSPLTFLKLWLLSTRWHNKILNWNCFHIFHMVNVFDPCDPIWPRVNF